MGGSLKKKAICLASVASNLDNFNRNNVKILQKLGYEVTLAANFYSKEDINSKEKINAFAKEMRAVGVNIAHIDFVRSPQKIGMQIRSILQVRKLLAGNYDLIHCHTPVCAAIVRALAHKYRKKYGARVIYTAHGFHFYQGAPFINWILYYPIEWLCSWWTDVLITINREDYNRAKKRMHAKKTVYVPGVGVDVERFRKDIVDVDKKRAELGLQDEDIMLLSVGELNRNKNHQIVIRAVAKLKNRHVYYFIAGKGERERDLLTLAKQLGIDTQVHLLSYRTDIPELLKAADMYLLPSIREGLNVSLMEAIACQVPVACSKIRGNEDIIRDYLFDENNVQELTHLLRKIVTTREELHVIMDKSVQENYERLKDFELPNVSKEMRIIYGMNQ